MGKLDLKKQARLKRKKRIRKHLVGTQERPRLNVFRSSKHIYAQVIDDDQGNTLITASTLDAEIKAGLNGKAKSARAGLVGTLVAKRALEKGIKQVVFDRGGYQYHGRVKALAEAARQAGLKF